MNRKSLKIITTISITTLLLVTALQALWIYRLKHPEEQVEPSQVARTSSEEIPASNAIPPSPLSDPDWDPFAEMQRMRKRMDQMFGEAFGRFDGSDTFSGLMDSPLLQSPRVNLSETKDAFVVTVDLPGADNSKIETKLDGQVLTIAAETERQDSSDRDEMGEFFHYMERGSGRFERSIYLSKPVDPHGMESEYDNGILKIRIPKLK